MATLGKRCLCDCDLILVAGCTSSFSFEWKKRNSQGVEELVDLTGASAICQIRTATADDELIADLSEYVTMLNGVVSIDISADVTDDIDEGRYVWDVIIEDTAHDKTRLAAGYVTVVDTTSKEEV